MGDSSRTQHKTAMPPAACAAQEQADFVPKKPKRVLSNVVAEYIEVTVGHDISSRTTDSERIHEEAAPAEGISSDEDEGRNTTGRPPEFVADLDCFVSPVDERIEPEYYKESKEVMEKFQETLKRFTKTLQSRDVFKKLNIEERDPAHYDLDYVQKIATSIQEYKEGQETTRSVKRFVLKCFRSAHEHHNSLTCLLDMVPNDLYGSVLSGSFSLILAAVESHHEARAKIQKTLASIPRKLHEIRLLTKVHRRLPRLHHCADQLFVSIFMVLERIIDKVSDSMRWRDKLLTRKGRDDDDISTAIELMEERVEEFRDEVNVCLQARIGRIGDDVVAIREGLSHVLERFNDGEKRPVISADQMEAKLQTTLLNTLYRFYASNPDFNPADGTLTRRDSELSSPKLLRGSTGLPFDAKRTKQLADTWLAGLGTFDPMPDNQLSDCLLGLPYMDAAEKDKAQWIMASKPVSTWLALDRSQILNIRPETAPIDIVNTLSFSAATLAFTLAKATEFPVLSFFSGFRRKGSRENSASGPKAVRKSLNAQLLKFIVAKRPSADLAFLERKKLMEKSRGKSKYAKELFRQLLESLPKQDVVFIVLDSLSRLGGTDREGGHDLVREMHALVKEMQHIVIKVLVTDAMPGSPIRDLAHLTLYVPDEIDGERQDSHAMTLDSQRLGVIERFQTRQRERSVSAEEDSSGVSSSDDDSY